MSRKFIDHATSYTNGVFTHGNTMEEAKGVADELRRQLALKGRRPEDFIISLLQNPIVGRTEKEAQEKYMELAQFTPETACLCHYFLVQPKRLPTRCSIGTSREQWIC
jgi:alkanesulfonate monooxygenase SsuD/methylene tetrahydromethanopterin reductase-like flavin-dependent oxidoreductase (luciferase family)